MKRNAEEEKVEYLDSMSIEEDSRVESVIADLQGQIRELCNQHSELPQPQTVFEIAKEVESI